MGLLDGKQIKNTTVSLSKLSGVSGIVTFTASATMSFQSGGVLRRDTADILINTDVVNKEYVDAVAAGLNPKESSRVIYNGDVTSEIGYTYSNGLSGVGATLSFTTLIVDGISTFYINERVIINSSTDKYVNGIYNVSGLTAGSINLLTRSTDFDGSPSTEINGGEFSFVTEGLLYSDTGWVVSSPDSTATVGVTDIMWVQFSAAGVITPGDGLIQTGTQFDINVGSGVTTGLTTSGDILSLTNTGVTAGVYGGNSLLTTFEVDSQGRLINASTASVTIGDAEDGTYTDGVFTDFTPTTPVGVAVDRFNELFMALVPASAPILSDWSAARSGTASNGKLSFDTSNPIAGSTYIGADIAPSPVSVDGTWTATGKRLSIYPQGNTSDFSGTLNSQVVASTTVPTPAYVAQSFGDAEKGTLKLVVNGVTVSTATLSTLTSINTTSGNTLSGFVLSAATSSKFASGYTFDTFENRTGTWLLKNNDANLVYGYNYVIAVHDNAPSFTRTLARYEFVIDHNTNATTFTGATISSYTLSGNKKLSGISYYTGGVVNYDLLLSNLYRNTYYSGSDAITFTDQSGAGNAGTNPILTATAQYSLPSSGGNELKTITLSTDIPGYTSFSVASSKRRLNDSIGLNSTSKRTVQGTLSGGSASITGVYLDGISETSTLLVENFNGETYRLKGGQTYDTYGSISTNAWDSNQSLIGGTAGWTDGLQVYNDKLIYPVTNFSTPGALTTNLNFGNSLTDYSTSSGDRVYIRYFRQVSPTSGNFTMTINGSTGTFVALGTSLTGNNIHVELKAPGLSTFETGWLDCYNDFSTAQWSDGDGARNATGGAGRAFGTAWGLTIGTKNTSNTSGYMVLRITVGSSFAGSFTDITFSFS